MISVSSSSLVNSPVVSAVLGSHGILETTLVTYSTDKLFPIGEERENSRIEVDCQWADCNKKFSHHDELINHVNEEHINSGKEIEYQCLWKGCNRKGRGFNARYKMLIHVRTHTNERPHKCTNCGKSFSRLENLKIHKRCHTGEKPYVCPVEGCNKAYTNSSDRFKHTRTHFEDKPYVCKWEGCNKRYTDPSSLRKHMKTYSHHSVNLKKGFPPSVARNSHTVKPIIQTLPSNMVILTETSNLISSPLFTISISPLPSSECILSSIVNEASPKKDKSDKCSELNKTKETELKESVSDGAQSHSPLDLSTNEPKTIAS